MRAALVVMVACAAPAPVAKQPVAVAPVVVKPPPPPPAILSCKTVEASSAPGYCDDLAKAPRGDSARAAAVWARLEEPYRATTGRDTQIAVLAPEARVDGQPIPPAAYICPGTPPTIFVPDTLITKIDDKDPAKYPTDFLAFVLGHELGHRLNDITVDGCQLGVYQRPGKGVQEEELADARAAFFITATGYSASKIARDDLVSRFLSAEYQLTKEESATRKTSLLGALHNFDGYEAQYQAALAVALSGDLDAADRVLTKLDEQVSASGVMLPELRVLRAIARIERAAPMAPWQTQMPYPVDKLRCTPLHPGHSALWEEPGERVRGPDIEQGRRLLNEALQLLDQAEARGATPFTVSSARACAALYLGDAARADAAQQQAEQLATPLVKQALAENRALIELLSHPGDEAPVSATVALTCAGTAPTYTFAKPSGDTIQIEQRSYRIAPPPPVLRELDAWVCGCASVARAGVSDRGERTYRVACPKLGLEDAVIVVGDHVSTVIDHSP